MAKDAQNITGVQKAAVLVIALGPEKSSQIFKHLKEEEIEELTLEIDSVVANQYMDSIRAAVLDTLKEFEVSTGKIFIKDKGALDCVIRARMETALKRGGVEQS